MDALLKEEIDLLNVPVLISVDGGINDRTAPNCIEKGANILVVGQYLFGKEDYQERYQKIVK